MSDVITGGCLCGKIRYTVNQPLQNIIACHCRNCQKASGAGMSHNAAVRTNSVTFTSGNTKVFEDTAKSGNTLYRHFCGDCGSPIYTQRANVPEMMALKVGTLDETYTLKLAMNIWTNSARSWAHIDPDVEHYPKNRLIKS